MGTQNGCILFRDARPSCRAKGRVKPPMASPSELTQAIQLRDYLGQDALT